MLSVLIVRTIRTCIYNDCFGLMFAKKIKKNRAHSLGIQVLLLLKVVDKACNDIKGIPKYYILGFSLIQS